MGRKRKEGNLLVAKCNGRVLAWCDGQFAGDAEFLRVTREAIRENRTIWLGGDVLAEATSPKGAAAAILSVSGAKLLEAPEDILRLNAIRENLKRLK